MEAAIRANPGHMELHTSSNMCTALPYPKGDATALGAGSPLTPTYDAKLCHAKLLISEKLNRPHTHL